jgi:hypothetical protein
MWQWNHNVWRARKSTIHEVLQFSPVSIIPPMLHTHLFIHHRRCIMFFSQYFNFPCQYNSTNAPYSFIHLPPTLYYVFLPVLHFPLSASLHQCSLLIRITVSSMSVVKWHKFDTQNTFYQWKLFPSLVVLPSEVQCIDFKHRLDAFYAPAILVPCNHNMWCHNPKCYIRSLTDM